ncbi:hypothetical protein E2C01_041733 [Portunus trituberculatus]|uniref:Uncharacterized protein n=1 Tax=Portunus trituberculatus TaxID=210409 RepID=A0A5B7FNC0_PORTR|nr:hypothetical protein [Portunus trituberculatus]
MRTCQIIAPLASFTCTNPRPTTSCTLDLDIRGSVAREKAPPAGKLVIWDELTDAEGSGGNDAPAGF